MNQITQFGQGPETGRGAALLCFSHLRWDFVLQRPQHLMSRAAQRHRVFFIEEPEHAPGTPHYRMRFGGPGVTVLTPVFEPHCDAVAEQRRLLGLLTESLRADEIIHWFYTPMALRFADGLSADLTVHDCMDELSSFKFAPPDLPQLERALMARADLVFTGGASLHAARRGRHPQVHCLPSSVDTAHFARARQPLADPADQAGLPHPRIGYFGVIDERMDLDLVARAAADLPDVQFVMLGPVVKIDPEALPRAANLHWLGRREYADLPAYMANWTAAWMPFALNEATRFISPTKTPEFLAAGLQVTSTAVADVVATWGRTGMVRIAGSEDIASALRASLSPPPADWSGRVAETLAGMSWDRTWQTMAEHMDRALHRAPPAVAATLVRSAVHA